MVAWSAWITSLLKDGFEELRYTLGKESKETKQSTDGTKDIRPTSQEDTTVASTISSSSDPSIVDEELQQYELKWKNQRMPNGW